MKKVIFAFSAMLFICALCFSLCACDVVFPNNSILFPNKNNNGVGNNTNSNVLFTQNMSIDQITNVIKNVSNFTITHEISEQSSNGETRETGTINYKYTASGFTTIYQSNVETYWEFYVIEGDKFYGGYHITTSYSTEANYCWSFVNEVDSAYIEMATSHEAAEYVASWYETCGSVTIEPSKLIFTYTETYNNTIETTTITIHGFNQTSLDLPAGYKEQAVYSDDISIG